MQRAVLNLASPLLGVLGRGGYCAFFKHGGNPTGRSPACATGGGKVLCGPNMLSRWGGP